MKDGRKNIKVMFFVAGIVVSFVLMYSSAMATDVQRTAVVGTTTPIIQLIEREKLNKPVEEITIEDILENEDVSEELKNRLNILLSKVQYEIDGYRKSIESYHKDIDKKILEVKREINGLYVMKDKIDIDSGIYKWMIISLCVGVGCLTAMIILMWKSVMNVNRNEVEVLYAIDNLKKDINRFEQILGNNEKL